MRVHITHCAACGNYYSTNLSACPNCNIPYVIDAVLTATFPAPKQPKVSKLEKKFLEEWEKTGLPLPTAEYRFHPVRRFRADFAWPELRLLVECEGGTWNGGRHVSGSGFADDCEKYNAAVELGYFVLRYPKIDSEAIAQVARVYRKLDRELP